MHSVTILYRSWKGSRATAKDAPGSQMFTSLLLVDGKPIVGMDSSDVDWSLTSITPSGFLALVLENVPEGLHDRWKPSEVLEGSTKRTIRLPVRSVTFVQEQR